MTDLPQFPDGLIISGNNQLDAEEGIGALRVFQLVPGIRAEIQVVPNDGPTGAQRDPYAGGEVTIMMQDVRVVGYENASALTIRATRDAVTGNGVAFTFVPSRRERRRNIQWNSTPPTGRFSSSF